MDHPAHPTAPARAHSVLATYTWAVSAATITAAALLLALGPPSALASAIVMLIAVAFIGLPHGAYDLEVARRLFADRLGRSWWALFGTAYLALTALGLALWLALPLLGLTFLLVGGAVHWGLDDLECDGGNATRRAWLALSRGAVPVAGPMVFHPAAVSEVFATILGATEIDPAIVQTAGLVWLGAAVPGIIASIVWTPSDTKGARLRVPVEIGVLLAWFAVAPPILAFTVYFCLWHSVRHSLRSAMSAAPRASVRAAVGRYLRAAAPPTVLTWVLAAAVALYWAGLADAVRISWSVVFIGLFALTVPHVTLEWFESRHGPAQA